MSHPRWPRAVWKGDGRPYGPLPGTDRGATVEQIRKVFHTTEGGTLPDYEGGAFAPHVTYIARTRQFVQHVDFDFRTGTMLGQSRTGVLGNEIAVQTEIVAYSDRALARKNGGLWVGDFADHHYADLAEWVRWCRENLFVPHLRLDRAYGPPVDFPSFIYGRGSDRGGRDTAEMSKTEWLAAGGILTAHGAGPGQDHWDTGVLDLHRIVRESLPATAPQAPVVSAVSTVAVPVSLLEQFEGSLAATLALVRKLRG